jgi:hypothetical protein
LLTSDRTQRNAVRPNRIYWSITTSVVDAILKKEGENHPSIAYLQKIAISKTNTNEALKSLMKFMERHEGKHHLNTCTT